MPLKTFRINNKWSMLFIICSIQYHWQATYESEKVILNYLMTLLFNPIKRNTIAYSLKNVQVRPIIGMNAHAWPVGMSKIFCLPYRLESVLKRKTWIWCRKFLLSTRRTLSKKEFSVKGKTMWKLQIVFLENNGGKKKTFHFPYIYHPVSGVKKESPPETSDIQQWCLP